MSIVWRPKYPEKSQMWQFMQFVAQKEQTSFTDYQALYQWSIDNSARFWELLCNFFAIDFNTKPHKILNHQGHMLDATWFDGATFNFAEKLLKRRDAHPAIISIKENGERHVLTYEELYQQVAMCAEGLKQAGIKVGDRVAALMPNIAQTIIAMLATTSLGAIWSSCSPDFGAQAAIDRFSQIEPTLLFTCNGHQYGGKEHLDFEKIKEIGAAIPSIQTIVICPNLNLNTDFDIPNACLWEAFVKPAKDCDFHYLPFAHPLYILFSSGTTGKPKCIVHGAGGTLLQHIKELGLHTDLTEHDNLFFYTTCGWMMWNWMVSVLALGATLTLYDGSPTYPDAYRLFQLIEKEKVTVFGTSAKFILAVDKASAKPNSQYELKSLRAILSTGSPLLPKNYDFVYQDIKPNVQLSSISGGTDIVSCFALGNPILPIYKGELQCFGLGMAVNVFDEQGNPICEKQGELVCTKPFPSMPIYFWNDKDKKAYHHAYFERYENVWAHGDFAEITKHNGLIIYGRSDAILNPGGVRIGTAEIYRQVEKISQVVDSIVIGQNWQDDIRIILFIKLQEGLKLDKDLEDLIRLTIRKNASPRHVPAKILQVPDIPRTMSGKIVEVAVRQVIHGQEINNVQSLANPEALNYFKNRPELQE
ncbi:acetoacetyl CoA synthetase [Legionella busanensis]|uniref:Acetoacetyl CoA synthetase n=1 Tax=Legionella busanensis TaxID=190655 RepID=A0A378JLN5_9GAMM|nr:acetoacetate--CoA ligase [Legionella busanensis]STX52236.1 acetoacetyl CoA synthetase [Legionella busanensis]